MNQTYCNNCGKYGHVFNSCKIPITSFGVVVFRINPQGEIEYLMVRRKDTLGYVDFMRGKYSIHNKYYIMNMIKQMTNAEKRGLLAHSFSHLWDTLWGNGEETSDQYFNEEHTSGDKFNALRAGVHFNGETYSLKTLINESDDHDWEYAEWGFPKGRRNYQERDYDCAVREFCEETGYDKGDLVPIQNMCPFEEIFIGSNYKSYKHKYYLNYMDYTASLKPHFIQASEISCEKWENYEKCMEKIRHYNLEKKQMLTQIHNTLCKHDLYFGVAGL